jgi:hypothetical protein
MFHLPTNASPKGMRKDKNGKGDRLYFTRIWDIGGGVYYGTDAEESVRTYWGKDAVWEM